MPSSKEAIVLVIISLLLIMLTFTSPVAFARPKHVLAPTQCTGNYNNLGVKTSTTCCDASWDEDTVTHKITNYMKWCRICDIAGGNCGPEWQEARQLGAGVQPPPVAGTMLPPSGNHTGIVTNGPPRLGTILPPSGNNTGAPGRTSIFSPIRNVTGALPGNNNNNTGTLPGLTVTKEHNPSPKLLNSQQSTTTCPNGLPPDANGNCPPTSTTTNANQQGGSASNNHHHKGSNNQPTQTGGGQETTVTKKHKGSKTDQGTSQPSS